MVQVDVFWSFALGAGFAASASRQLQKEDKPFESKYFVKTLLYLSIFFVPSGATLLWGFPEWETMQAGTYRTIPAWLVMLFSITNVTQGILGYWVAYRFVKAGNTYAALLMTLLGYFCMFFILVHGWDGTGYQRFFYTCWWWGADQCALWRKGDMHFWKWLVGPVALTLYAMGAVMMPLLFHWMSDWIKSGYDLGGINVAKARETSRRDLVNIILRLVFIHTLGGAIAASFLVRYLGWILGPIVFAALTYLVLVRPGGLTHREAERLILPEA
jgi:hypothetical protein